MTIRDWWRNLWHDEHSPLEPARKLDVGTGFNVRELGGYRTAEGVTCYRRFVRSGGLETLSQQDQQRLYEYGVRLVVDLRGDYEVRAARDRIAELPGIRFLHASLYDYNLSDPALERGEDEKGYLSLGYFTMLANRDAVRKIFSFFATAQPDECVLFHCAAGMDRTGVTAALLLGLAGATKRQIVADYCYSFGSVDEVDRMMEDASIHHRRELEMRRDAMDGVMGRLNEVYGSVGRYLEECGVSKHEINAVRAHLLNSF